MILESNEKIIDEKDIWKFEKKYSLKLPEDYTTFLIKTNGGYLKQFLCTPDFEEVDSEGNINVQSINPDQFFSLEEVEEEYEANSEDPVFADKFIPIAIDSSGNYILMKVKDEKAYGAIYFANHELYDENNMNIVTKIANSFAIFIDSLKPFEE